MVRWLAGLFILALAAGCGQMGEQERPQASKAAGATQEVSAPKPSGGVVTYQPAEGLVLNPERGFFTPYVVPGPAGFSPVRLTGNTLVHWNIRLDEWREEDLPQEVLEGLGQNFADLREAGLKVILRVAYNEGPYPDSKPDASREQILRHIAQLKPLFNANGDVIAWVEAGFIGAWGEWHTSTHGLDNLADKRAILEALLAALPADRFVQVRYPANIIEMYPQPGQAAAARVAHHNDCFLSSDTDVGTYERDGVNTIERDQAYLAELTSTTPMSGETCAPNPPRSECNSALREMELLHFSALNEAYHKGILRSWEDDGCLDEINERLGYRLVLTTASFDERVPPGGLLRVEVNLENRGFAALMNPRPLFLALAGPAGLAKNLVELELDPRDWRPGASSFSLALRLPQDLPEGTYRLALWLPDAAVALRNDSRYAVRFANQGTWDEQTGYNHLGELQVDASAEGSREKFDTLTVIELSFSAGAPLPTTTPPAEAALAEPVSGLEAVVEGEELVVRFAYTGAKEDYNGFQLFLDTDQDPRSGMSVTGLGADFMVENEKLSTYQGSGADWNWEETEAELVYTNASGEVEWRIPLAVLEETTALDYAVQLVDTNWDTVFITPRQTLAP